MAHISLLQVCIVDLVLPVVIILLEDFELDSVVTSSDGGHVPLKLLDLATLVKISDSNSEQETDQRSSAHSQRQTIVFLFLLLGALDTFVLNEEYSLVSQAITFAQRVLVQSRR